MPEINAIIQQMTLAEKAALCTGATAWTTTPIERLGVPEMSVSDGPHGVRKLMDGASMGGESFPATCFPTASCQAASWNLDLMRFSLDLPLLSSLHFQEAFLPVSPEEMVDGLLAQIE